MPKPQAPVVLSVPTDEATEPTALPARESRPKHLTGEDGRAILREGMANIGLGRHYGNVLADWFDDQEDIDIYVQGRVVPAPTTIHSEPDQDPVIERAAPFNLGGPRVNG